MVAQTLASNTSLRTARTVTVLSCTDVARSRAFYEKTLGLKTAEARGQPGFTITTEPGTETLVYQRAEPPKAENTVLSFTVDDVPAVVNALRAKGVEFQDFSIPDGPSTVEGIATMGDHQAAWFDDPDGNTICIENGS